MKANFWCGVIIKNDKWSFIIFFLIAFTDFLTISPFFFLLLASHFPCGFGRRGILVCPSPATSQSFTARLMPMVLCQILYIVRIIGILYVLFCFIMYSSHTNTSIRSYIYFFYPIIRGMLHFRLSALLFANWFSVFARAIIFLLIISQSHG